MTEIERLQHLIERYRKRLIEVHPSMFHSSLRQFVHFVESHAILGRLIKDLTSQFDRTVNDQAVDLGSTGLLNIRRIDIEALIPFTDVARHAAFSYHLLYYCSRESKPSNIEQSVGAKFECPSTNSSESTAIHIGLFCSLFLMPLLDYLSDQLESQHSFITLITAYKHKTEWYRRDALRKARYDQSQGGEDLLFDDLCEFLVDKGISFAVKPSSVNGIADMVSSTIQSNFVADAKVFCPPTHPHGNIIKGFHQVYLYLQNHNLSHGFLLVYKCMPERLEIEGDGEVGGIQYVRYNGKMVYFPEIDISEIEVSASKAGRMSSKKIARADLINELSQHGS